LEEEEKLGAKSSMLMPQLAELEERRAKLGSDLGE
jgi:hypothetical protein